MEPKRIGRIMIPSDEPCPIDDGKDPVVVEAGRIADFGKPKNMVKPQAAAKQEKKYEITRIPQKVGTTNVFVGYRIRALRDFSDVKKGDLGGCVQNERNLSQSGDCWIYPGAICAGFATVKDNAILSDGAVAFDHAVVSENARATGNDCMIGGRAHVHGNAIIIESFVENDSNVYGDAIVENHSHITGNAKIYENAIIHMISVDSASIHGDCIPESDVWSGDHSKNSPSNEPVW